MTPHLDDPRHRAAVAPPHALRRRRAAPLPAPRRSAAAAA